MDASTKAASALRKVSAAAQEQSTPRCGGDMPKWLQPVPNWDKAEDAWGGLWDAHVYIFATAFLVVFLTAAFRLLAHMRDGNLPGANRALVTGRRINVPRRSSLTAAPVLLLVAIVGFFRMLSLYIDPYGSRCHLPPWLGRTFFTIGNTGLLAAFQLLFYAVFTALQVKLTSLGWLSKRWLLFGIIAFFFFFNILIDLLLLTAMEERVLLILCMVFNILWGLAICIQFLYLHVSLHKRHAESLRLQGKFGRAQDGGKSGVANDTDGAGFNRGRSMSLFGSRAKHRQEAEQKKKNSQRSHERAMWFTATAAICGLAMMGFMLSMLVGLIRSYDMAGKDAPPWMWYGIQTSLRIIELIMASSLLWAVFASPTTKQRNATANTAGGGSSSQTKKTESVDGSQDHRDLILKSSTNTSIPTSGEMLLEAEAGQSKVNEEMVVPMKEPNQRLPVKSGLQLQLSTSLDADEMALSVAPEEMCLSVAPDDVLFEEAGETNLSAYMDQANFSPISTEARETNVLMEPEDTAEIADV